MAYLGLGTFQSPLATGAAACGVGQAPPGSRARPGWGQCAPCPRHCSAPASPCPRRLCAGEPLSFSPAASSAPVQAWCCHPRRLFPARGRTRWWQRSCGVSQGLVPLFTVWCAAPVPGLRQGRAGVTLAGTVRVGSGAGASKAIARGLIRLCSQARTGAHRRSCPPRQPLVLLGHHRALRPQPSALNE